MRHEKPRASSAAAATRRNSKRIFLTAIAVIALAVAPCAWDADPREQPAIAALFASATSPLDVRSAQAASALDRASLTASLVVEPSREVSNGRGASYEVVRCPMSQIAGYMTFKTRRACPNIRAGNST